jgi:hypothetical protein
VFGIEVPVKQVRYLPGPWLPELGEVTENRLFRQLWNSSGLPVDSAAIARGPDYFSYGLSVLPVAEAAAMLVGCSCLRVSLSRRDYECDNRSNPNGTLDRSRSV